MDLSMEIAERSLEVVRSSIEAAAARERDEAAARLLSELELEDASKKVTTIWLPVDRGLHIQMPSLEQLRREGHAHLTYCSNKSLHDACELTLLWHSAGCICTQAAEEKKGKAKKAKKKAAKAAKGGCSAQ